MKKIRKALFMPNGVAVHSLEELNNNWDIGSVYKYYLSGELLTWLKDRYYLEQFDKLSYIDNSDEEFVKKTLCELFNQQYIENCNQEVCLLSDVKKLEREASNSENNFLEIDKINPENKSEVCETQRTKIESEVIAQSANEVSEMALEETEIRRDDAIDDNTEDAMDFPPYKENELQENVETREVPSVEDNALGCKENFSEIDKKALEEKSVLCETQGTEMVVDGTAEDVMVFSEMTLEEGVIRKDDGGEDDIDVADEFVPEKVVNETVEHMSGFSEMTLEESVICYDDGGEDGIDVADDFVSNDNCKIDAKMSKEDEHELSTQSQCEDCIAEKENNSKNDKSDRIMARLKLLYNFGFGVALSFAALRYIVSFLFNVEIINKYTVWLVVIAGGLVFIATIGIILLWVCKIIFSIFK